MAESDTVSPSRAERPLVLAFDIGSSSIRAAIHDRLGRTVGGTAVQVQYTWQTDGAGRVRLPYATFVGLLERALDGIETRAAALLGDVVAGGVASIIHSIVGLDERGRPMTPVLSWADTSSATEATALRARLDAEAVRATTGAPIHAGYWPARVGRLRDEQPSVERWAGVAELLLEHLSRRESCQWVVGQGIERGLLGDEPVGDVAEVDDQRAVDVRVVGDVGLARFDMSP